MRSVVSSPNGVRGGTTAENKFGAFYMLYGTLLVEEKSNMFIDNYSDT